MTQENPKAEAPDYDEIVRLIHVYTDTFGKGDRKALEEAFHVDATYFWTEPDGTLEKGRIFDVLDDWATPQSEPVEGEPWPPAPIEGRIISVTQAGDIANILLGFDIVGYPDRDWVDLHNLIRVDGVWKITNKTATHTSRAAWASRLASE